jgi:crotonobetainyl-CoA:carnitine CoA-transferase CaiB-like acyl-CoA transferase
VLPYTDRHFRSFFALAGRPELADDPRYRTLSDRLAHIDELYADVARLLATRTSSEWLDDLDSANIPAMQVNDPDDLPEDPHLAETSFWELREDPELGTLRLPGVAALFSRTPGSIRRLPPRLGEHSVEILKEAGHTDADIDALLATGATR